MMSRRPGVLKRRRVAMAVVGFFLLVIVGVALALYAKSFVFPSKELVVRVDDVEYTRGDMVTLMRSQQAQAEMLGFPYRVGEEVFRALQGMVESEVLVQAAPRLGITVSEEEVDNVIRGLFSARLTSDEEDEGQLEREFQERYKQYLNEVQLSKSEDRTLVRRSLLREKVKQHIGDSVPTVVEQVHLYRLVVAPTDEIDIIQGKYVDAADISKDPEDLAQAFKEIVREFSRDDPETVRKGGDLGWVPEGIFHEYDFAFFDLEPGELSKPTPNINDTDVLFFFMVSEIDEAREVEPRNLDALKSRALQEWLNEERNSHDIFAEFNSDIYAWVIEQMRLTIKVTPTPEPASPFGS